MRIVKESGRGRGRRGRRSLSDREVWQFTHEDVKNGIIHYVPSVDLVDSSSPINDSFVFRLLAPGVQPANGVLPFTVYPEVYRASHKALSQVALIGLRPCELALRQERNSRNLGKAI